MLEKYINKGSCDSPAGRSCQDGAFAGAWARAGWGEAIALLSSALGGASGCLARVSPQPVVCTASGLGKVGVRANVKSGVNPRSPSKIHAALPHLRWARLQPRLGGHVCPELGAPVGAPAPQPCCPPPWPHCPHMLSSAAWPACQRSCLWPGAAGGRVLTETSFSPANGMRKIHGHLLGGDMSRRVSF